MFRCGTPSPNRNMAGDEAEQAFEASHADFELGHMMNLGIYSAHYIAIIIYLTVNF